ncbi:Bdr family repetitive protein [Borreliella afzelii]|uniref:Outer membrane murein-binding lipoprotein Lpp n=1 Tax=Borreliella afzelii TaxID=29518 RepID=A0AB34Z3E5_BORAF|nr:outer membrane murein-binding lipoprotein Lpp [Borreliella afzelii]
MKPALPNIASVTEEQIYNEFIRLGMEQLIAQDLSKRYYHNELTYRDLENLEKQFGIKFDNLVSKIDSVEKNLDTKIDSVKSELNTKIDGLETKIDSVKNELNTKIDFVEKNLETKIDGLKNEFNAKIDGLNTKIENLDTKIDTVEKNLKKDMKINSELLLEKLKVSNRLIIIITVIIAPIAISSIANIITSIINGFPK